MTLQTVLHVGPGHRLSGARLPPVFHTDAWKEVRLDIDPLNEPDLIGSILDMQAVASHSVDAIYSSHNIEHVYPHEVSIMLKEFLRVLTPAGFLIVTCPDLQTVAQLIADDKLTDTAYLSPAGPITPLDILYGHRPALAQGNHYMAHKCGFTLKVLMATLKGEGFQAVAGKRRVKSFDLWAFASKSPLDEVRMGELAQQYLP